MTAFSSQVISMRCLQSAPGAHCEFHKHPFHEFTLVTGDETTNGYALGKARSIPNTLYLFHPGELHGHWNAPNQSPRFWVIHFGSEIYDCLAHLSDPDPAKRIWHLSIEQVAIFKWLFIKLFNEQTQPLVHRKLAEAAWLKLLLINIERWIAGEIFQELLPEQPDADVLQLWHIVNDCAGDWTEFTKRISSLQNYDSARHRFKSMFGAPPTQLLFRLRMQKAKNLLLETAMSIKEIAELLGYERQHEFARAFRKHTGMSPTEWRTYLYPEKVPEQIAGKLFSVSFSQ